MWGPLNVVQEKKLQKTELGQLTESAYGCILDESITSVLTV